MLAVAGCSVASPAPNTRRDTQATRRQRDQQSVQPTPLGALLDTRGELHLPRRLVASACSVSSPALRPSNGTMCTPVTRGRARAGAACVHAFILILLPSACAMWHAHGMGACAYARMVACLELCRGGTGETEIGVACIGMRSAPPQCLRSMGLVGLLHLWKARHT